MLAAAKITFAYESGFFQNPLRRDIFKGGNRHNFCKRRVGKAVFNYGQSHFGTQAAAPVFLLHAITQLHYGFVVIKRPQQAAANKMAGTVVKHAPYTTGFAIAILI